MAQRSKAATSTCSDPSTHRAVLYPSRDAERRATQAILGQALWGAALWWRHAILGKTIDLDGHSQRTGTHAARSSTVIGPELGQPSQVPRLRW